MEWKEQAEAGFFEKHMAVGDIAEMTGKSRQTISAYLKTLTGYQEEKDRRKSENRMKRKEYKKRKNQEYRGAMAVTGETLRREHDIAALILSREKYY